MKTPSDISKALVTELKTLRERHLQFQTRVKAADKVARERDEEAQKQNKVLTQRIVGLESELMEARESIEALRQFVELLPTVKTEFDALEDDIGLLETLGNSTSSLEQISSATEKLDAVEQRIRSFTGPHSSSVGFFSDVLNDSIAAPSVNSISSKYPATTGDANTLKGISIPVPYAELQPSDSHPDPPVVQSRPDEPLQISCKTASKEALAQVPPPPTTPLYPHVPDPFPV